jgi:delta24-sterol reductase
MFVDVGAYGPPHKKPYNHMKDMPKMEKFVRDIKGYQALYAHTYMTESEFREMFDHTLYDQMRTKLNANEAFPQVYFKVSGKGKAK